MNTIDPGIIEQVGKDDLPEIVQLIRKAGIQADMMDTISPKAFSGDLYEDAGESWSEASGYLVDALARTTRNLSYCADALVVIADSYRDDETDGYERITAAGDSRAA